MAVDALVDIPKRSMFVLVSDDEAGQIVFHGRRHDLSLRRDGVSFYRFWFDLVLLFYLLLPYLYADAHVGQSY